MIRLAADLSDPLRELLPSRPSARRRISGGRGRGRTRVQPRTDPGVPDLLAGSALSLPRPNPDKPPKYGDRPELQGTA